MPKVGRRVGKGKSEYRGGDKIYDIANGIMEDGAWLNAGKHKRRMTKQVREHWEIHWERSGVNGQDRAAEEVRKESYRAIRQSMTFSFP